MSARSDLRAWGLADPTKHDSHAPEATRRWRPRGALRSRPQQPFLVWVWRGMPCRQVPGDADVSRETVTSASQAAVGSSAGVPADLLASITLPIGSRARANL